MKFVSQNRQKKAQEAFANLSTEDPLQKLSARQKTYLFELLSVHPTWSGYPEQSNSAISQQNDSVVQVRKIGRQAQRLVDQIESEVIAGKSRAAYDAEPTLWNEALKVLRTLAEFQDIPRRGVDNSLIMVASYFVRIATGKLCDQSLAELVEAITGIAISGEGIAKQRSRLTDEEKSVYQGFAVAAYNKS